MLSHTEAASSQRDDKSSADAIFVLSGASWADYQRLMELRGERRAPRLAFLEGEIELMGPSQNHEALKSLIGQLVEVWCLEAGVEFSAYGSWTLENKESQRGVEPDECYIFGEPSAKRVPDLAIEVIWTPGGLDKKDIYRRLGVRELWFWRKGRIFVHVLRGDAYVEVAQSEVLTGIDPDVLTTFLDRPTASQAIREYRAALARKG